MERFSALRRDAGLSVPGRIHGDNLWIMDAWTGLNFGYDARVGEHTGTEGVLGEVAKFCREEPSDGLVHATIETYKQLDNRRYRRAFQAFGRAKALTQAPLWQI